MIEKKKTAVYPGSFDPFTRGHLDIYKRACRLFDEVIVLIGVNPKKSGFFSIEERTDLIMRSVTGGLVIDPNNPRNPRVERLDGLLIDYCMANKASVVIRGIRAITDYEYEQAMFHVNHDLEPSIETVFLFAQKEHSFVSSSMVKEIAAHRNSAHDGVLCRYVTPVVADALDSKFILETSK